MNDYDNKLEKFLIPLIKDLKEPKIFEMGVRDGISTKKIINICSLKIFIPHAVEPAHPPINIKNKKKIKENFPHKPKSSVTYPVPDKIEITLNDEILILSNKLLS